MKVEDLICLGNKVIHKDQVKLLLGTILDMNPLEINLHLNDLVSDNLVIKYKDCLNCLKDGEPLQYALKSVNFYGIDYYVDKRVLIPRFETEELVLNVHKYIEKYFKEPSLLDLGTGSGCIGLTLKKLNPTLDVTLSDISKEALEVASINKENLGLSVNIVESDLFMNINKKFDVLVSNPPYVAYDDEIDKKVLENEPHIALFADNNGLEYYERILKDCCKYLNDKYLIALEIGAYQKDKVLELINKYLKDVKIIDKKDLSNRDRMIFIFKNIDLNE